MKQNKDVLEQNHRWYFEKSFSCSEKYDQFINWLGVEFYFFQQEHGSDFTIYFPNGQVQVKREEELDATLVSKIMVESKCRKVGAKIKKTLSDFLDHIENYNRLSQVSVLN